MTTTPTSAPSWAAKSDKPIPDRREWWRTAPNPECRSWCDQTHAADEFATSAGFNCIHILHDSDAGRVDVQQWRGADGDSLEVEPANVWVSISPEVLTSEQATAMASAMLTAARTAAEANS